MPKRTRSAKISDEKGNKPYAYGVNAREKNRSFLIVCEGQNEEQYFKSFPVLTATIQPIHHGHSKTALVDAVKRYVRGGSYDEIWCVFDFDINPLIEGQNADFNRAVKKAHDLGYWCAYSNDAFELWFVLHYQFVDQEEHRNFYYKLLSKQWGINYIKEGKTLKFARSLYDNLLKDRQANQGIAIEHARKLLTIHGKRPCHLQNPVTTVFQLVEGLNQYCRK